MGSTAVEKTEEELRKEIDELHRQQRELMERLRDPRGLRRGGFPGADPRNVAANGARQRGFVRPADRTDNEDQPPAKRRLLSAVVKVEDGEIIEDAEAAKDVKTEDSLLEGDGVANQIDKKPSDWQQGSRPRRDFTRRAGKMEFDAPETEPLPRVLPKNEDPSLVNQNKRMPGQLLGTLEEKFDEFLADSARTGGDGNGDGEQGSDETTQPSQAGQTRMWFEASFAVKKKGKVYGMGSLARDYARSIGVSMYGTSRSKADRQDSATSEEVSRLKRKLAHIDNEIAALKQTIGGMEKSLAMVMQRLDMPMQAQTGRPFNVQVDDQFPPAPVAVESSPAQGDDADEDDEQQDSSN